MLRIKIKRHLVKILLLLLLFGLASPSLFTAAYALPESNDSDDAALEWTIQGNRLTIQSDKGMEQWMEVPNEERAEYAKSIREIQILSDVTSITDRAFMSFAVLEKVTFSEGLQNIGEYAFAKCYELKNIQFPNTLKHIANCAFQYNTSLKKVVLPDSVDTFAFAVFFGCVLLENIVLPKNSGVDVLDNSFWDTGITAITLPPNIKNLDAAFSGICIQRLVIGADGIFIHDRMLEDCPNLQQLVFMSGPPLKYDELFYSAIATPSIYYLEENRKLWAPNGETNWEGLPLVEIRSLKELPDIQFKIHNLEDRLKAFGWLEIMDSEQRSINKLTIATDAGWMDMCRTDWCRFSADEMIVSEGVAAIGINRRWNQRISAGILRLPATLHTLELWDDDQIDAIELAPNNPYYHMENGKLFDTGTGAIIWPREPEETPLPTKSSQPSPTASPSPNIAATPSPAPDAKIEQEGIDWVMYALLGIVVLVAIAIIILGIKMRKKRN